MFLERCHQSLCQKLCRSFNVRQKMPIELHDTEVLLWGRHYARCFTSSFNSHSALHIIVVGQMKKLSIRVQGHRVGKGKGKSGLQPKSMMLETQSPILLFCHLSPSLNWFWFCCCCYLFVCFGIKIKATELDSVYSLTALYVCSSLVSPTGFMSSLRASTRAQCRERKQTLQPDRPRSQFKNYNVHEVSSGVTGTDEPSVECDFHYFFVSLSAQCAVQSKVK